jgi:hypothetical protein
MEEGGESKRRTVPTEPAGRMIFGGAKPLFAIPFGRRIRAPLVVSGIYATLALMEGNRW